MRSGGFIAWLVVPALVGGASSAVLAEPSLDASGFIGLGWFGDDTELGNSWAPEQVPGTAPVLGLRLGGVLAELARLGEPHERRHVALALEAELAMAASYTGGSSFTDASGRMSYFAPVFGWRLHAVLRAGGSGHVTPHLVAGVGGETVASSSPFMSKETDAVAYYGPGVAIPVGDRWHVRADLRHGIMPGRSDATSSMFELQLGVGARLGAVERRGRARVVDARPPRPVKRSEPLPEPPPAKPIDSDGDGITDAADTCAGAAEDRDGWIDDDGCPELDNDMDGIEDTRDRCPLEVETINQFADEDGCRDVVPVKLSQAFEKAGRVRFEARRARLTATAQQALEPLVAVLYELRDVRIVVVAHPDKGGQEVAKRRAEAVKWYLVDAGITENRVKSAIGAATPAPISIQIAPSTPPPSTPPAKP